MLTVRDTWTAGSVPEHRGDVLLTVRGTWTAGSIPEHRDDVVWAVFAASATVSPAPKQ